MSRFSGWSNVIYFFSLCAKKQALLVALSVVLGSCQSTGALSSSQANQAEPEKEPPLDIVLSSPIAPRTQPQRSKRIETSLPPDAGYFNRCAACHSLTPGLHGIGPSLAGVFGKPAASQEGYRYSDALRRSDLVWDPATLDGFLTNPRGHVSGTKMAFSGFDDPAKRAQVIALIERYRSK